MTFRQKEFCRHYAKGCSAAEAAQKAGYAKTTIETNAARILRNPKAEARIRRLRGEKIIRREDAELSRAMLLKSIQNPHSQHALTASIHALIRLQNLELAPGEDEHELFFLQMQEAQVGEAPSGLPSSYQHFTQPVSNTPTHPENPANPGHPDSEKKTNEQEEKDRFSPQSSQYQWLTPTQEKDEFKAELEEQDTLPTGQEAFDQPLPQKPKPIPPKPEPITIKVVSLIEDAPIPLEPLEPLEPSNLQLITQH